MKILRITESQYKRLVRGGRKLLSEQVVYVDEKDQKDLHAEMGVILDSISYNVYSVFKKPLYVKKIEDGVVYIDKTKYTQNEIDYIRADFENHVNSPLSTVDRLLSNPSDLGYDSGYDADYDWGDEDITVVEPDDDTTEDIEDNDDVAEIEDNDDVAEIDDDETEDISYCDYGINSEGEKRKFIPPPNMDIKFYQDILKSIGANITCQKMLFFYAWRTGESSKSSYNPFATTQPNEVNEGCYYNCLKSGRGYTPVGCRECPSGTSPGVRNYKTYESGLKNTVKTLTNGRYNNVVTKLKNDNITAEEIASEKSELKTWGTGGLVLKILKYNETIKPTPISKYGDEPQYVLPDDENIIDCENCITTELNNKHEEHINDENVKDFRWWINQDSNRLKSVTDKLKECCETKDDPTISTGYNKKNNHTIIAFSVVGNEWINTNPKPKKTDGEESIETVGGDCNLTEEEQQLFDSTIFNFKTANNFRWWIHQDKDRLEKVEKKLKSCGLSPELGIVCKWTVGIESPIGSTFFENQYMNRFGNYLKIPFKLYGSDWVNSGSVRPKSTYKNSNGNLLDNDLVAIQDDVSSNPEYLHKDAVDSWNKMVLSAKTDGIDLTISDAYRPCGEPGDYERYLNKEVRFTQWAAWREWNYRSKKAAEPKPNTEEKWIKKGGGKCKSHHGFKGAVDISNGKSWMRKNAPKFGWCKYTGEDWHWDYYGDDIDNKLSSDKVNCK